MGNSPSHAEAIASAKNGIQKAIQGVQQGDTTESTTADEDKARLQEKDRIRDERDSALIYSYQAKKQERAARKAKLKDKWASHKKKVGS